MKGKFHSGRLNLMAVRNDIRNLTGYRYSGRKAQTKLDQNESPDDLPMKVKEALLTRLAEIPFNRYPEPDARQLRRRIAAKYGWEELGVIVAGGSNELIRSAVITAGIGRSVVTVKPTFPVYADQARILSAELIEIPLTETFELPLQAIEEALEGHRGVVFIANPAAPTGNLFGQEQLEHLAKRTARDWILILDEAYHQFASSDSLSLVRRHPHLVSLRTFSKAFGLGGVRVGYGFAHPDLATEMRKTVMPFALSALQVAAAETALDLDHLIRERVEATLRERKRLHRALASLETHPYPSETNFILFRVPDPEAVFEGLVQRGVLVRRQDHLDSLTGALRVTVGRPEENEKFLQALAAVLGVKAGD